MLTFDKKIVNLSDKMFDEIVSRITASYPNACVLWMDEIVNDEMLARYMQKKEKMERKGPVKELLLFHGTKEHCVESICAEGLRSDLNITSAFGKGTYFAKDAAVSVHYMGLAGEIVYMLVCNVLVGNAVPAHSRALKETECWVNDPRSPTIFVVPEDDSIYVRYVVAFHRKPPI